jgi:L-iditol 2-dehydrogenase
MIALVKTQSGVGHVELTDVPEPICGPNQIKIEVAYTGICGTDLHVYHDTFRNYPPVILGHEFSGIVREIGAQTHSSQVGDRVTVCPASAVICGRCEHCRQGYYMFCPIRRGMGHGVNGSFTRYVVVAEHQVYKVLDDMALDEAALVEPFAAAWQAITELTSFTVGETVLLSGPGPIGLLCLLILKGQGCKVIVAGTAQDASRLRLAQELGADTIVNVSTENLQEIVAQRTDSRGVDATVEASGAAASINACLQAVRKQGKFVQVGIAGHEVPVQFDTILYKQLGVFGSVGHSRKTYEGVMRVLGERTLCLSPLISHRLPLSRWREAFDLCEQKQGIKALLYSEESEARE